MPTAFSAGFAHKWWSFGGPTGGSQDLSGYITPGSAASATATTPDEVALPPSAIAIAAFSPGDDIDWQQLKTSSSAFVGESVATAFSEFNPNLFAPEMIEATAANLRAYDEDIIKKVADATIAATPGRAIKAKDIRTEQGISGCEVFRTTDAADYTFKSPETYLKMAHVLLVNAAGAIDQIGCSAASRTSPAALAHQQSRPECNWHYEDNCAVCGLEWTRLQKKDEHRDQRICRNCESGKLTSQDIPEVKRNKRKGIKTRADVTGFACDHCFREASRQEVLAEMSKTAFAELGEGADPTSDAVEVQVQRVLQRRRWDR